VFRRRDHLIMQLSCLLAESRAREAALTERLAWYTAVKPTPALRLVGEKACSIPTDSSVKSGDNAAPITLLSPGKINNDITAGQSR
jgi:hypothetical protein